MKITVVGDTLLDVDMTGAATRLSPDAPVPVVDVGATSRRAGGAGLVAAMLARDGHQVRLVTALADDQPGRYLKAALPGVELIAGACPGQTPVKIRIRADGQAVVRVDEGCGPARAPEVTDAMIAAMRSADAIVVADYGRGLTSDSRLRAALRARGAEVPLVWDPHPRGADPVPSAAVATPNLAEAKSAAGIEGPDVEVAVRAAAILHKRWKCRAVAVTMGARGALLHTPDVTGGFACTAPLVLPAPKVPVADPCGAGDRLSATVVVKLVGGSTLAGALTEGVRSAAAFLAVGGVNAMDIPQNARQLPGSTAALRVARETRRAGGTVVATGGCFDLLHAGHARTLLAARRLGDCLIVCLNSDASVSRLKGVSRPLVPEEDRVDLLMALECVDAVMVFDEDTPEAAIRRLEPDLWVKGGDYTSESLPEAAILGQWGGRTVTVPYYPGRSTTGLVTALSRVG